MSITVSKGHFDGLRGAITDIGDKGLFPTTYASDHATTAELHWHTEDVFAYLVEGKTFFLDGDGEEYPLEPGDLITIPAKTLHAEDAIDEPVVMLIGLGQALPMEHFLLPRDPADL